VILPDVNVLVYAFRREAQHHDRYASWLRGVIGGSDELALAENVLTGFLRIVTNPRVMADPAPIADALAFVNTLRRARRSRSVAGTEATWTRLANLAADDQHVRGNVVPDAWLAALALSHGCRLATADRGFARFPGLDWFDPA
jgi:toxin-antitoxin system PIN domain toxin